jgi:2Fe-2S ferredoxin
MPRWLLICAMRRRMVLLQCIFFVPRCRYDYVERGDDEGSEMLSEYIECACSGVMACSTCHVVIDPDWFDRVGPPSEEEMDMLDLAFEPQETSRLGCARTNTRVTLRILHTHTPYLQHVFCTGPYNVCAGSFSLSLAQLHCVQLQLHCVQR